MLDLNQFYQAIGSNAEETVKRLGVTEGIITKFLKKFLADTSYSDLQKALDENDTQTAFRMAHTLKGLAANLGLQVLFTKASAVTELLRAGDLEEAKVSMPVLQEEYERTVALIEQLA